MGAFCGATDVITTRSSNQNDVRRSHDATVHFPFSDKKGQIGWVERWASFAERMCKQEPGWHASVACGCGEGTKRTAAVPERHKRRSSRQTLPHVGRIQFRRDQGLLHVADDGEAPTDWIRRLRRRMRDGWLCAVGIHSFGAECWCVEDMS